MAPNSNTRITVEALLESKGFDKLDKIGSNITNLGKKGEKLSEQFSNVSNGMYRTLTIGSKMSKGQRVITNVTERTSKAFAKFDSRMLTVMFTSMAVERAVNGIVKSQWDLWGITELTAAAWTVTMLPAMEEVSGVMYDLLNSFMSLPEEMQKVVGYGVLFTDFGAKVVTGLAMARMAFPTFGTALDTFLASIYTKMGGASGVASLLGKAVTIGVSLKWAGDTIENLDEGHIGSAIGNMLKSGGAIYSIFGKKKGLGMAAIGIGAAIEIGDTYFRDGPEAAKKSLEDNLVNIGIVAGATGNWYLAGALFITWGGIKYGDKLFGKEGAINKIIGDIPNPFLPGGSTANSIFNKKELGVNKPISIMDGIVKPNGSVIKTAPEDYIFATKNPENMAGASGVNVINNYNVNVSDKREFEILLRNNNLKLTEDVRRFIKT